MHSDLVHLLLLPLQASGIHRQGYIPLKPPVVWLDAHSMMMRCQLIRIRNCCISIKLYCFCGLKNRVQSLHCVTMLQPYGATFRREVGPVNVKFTVPMYSASRMQLQYLHITRKDWNYNPQRWVRYVTSSTSYIFRT